MSKAILLLAGLAIFFFVKNKGTSTQEYDKVPSTPGFRLPGGQGGSVPNHPEEGQLPPWKLGYP